MAYGYLPTEEYEVKWPHIEVLGEKEKVEGAKGWAAVNHTQGEVVYTVEEIRDHWSGLKPLSAEQKKAIADEAAAKMEQQQAAVAATASGPGGAAVPAAQPGAKVEAAKGFPRAAGGAGSGWTAENGHVPGTTAGWPDNVGEKPARAFVLNEEKLKTEAGAEAEFHRAIREQYPQGLVAYHETDIANVASIKKNGLDDGSFATVGKPSDFVTTADKALVEVALTPRQSQNITPDMRYGTETENPFADLLHQHNGIYGADISLNQPIPHSYIRIREGGKVRAAEESLDEDLLSVLEAVIAEGDEEKLAELLG
jgi:hypothetical protein